jgi:excisionase family DNA binding protein
MSTPITETPFASIGECAKRLGLSVDTLERHVRPGLRTGEIVSYKIGSRRVISWASLLEYLKRHHSGALQ